MQITEGQIFIRKGTKLPDQLRSQMSAIDADWLALSDDDASTLDKQVRAANWHLFCLRERVQGWAIARDKGAASKVALRRAVRKIARPWNATEIVGIQYKSLCGFCFCRVQLKVRHIQREMILPLTPAVGLISPAAKPERWISQPLKEPQELAAA